MRRRERKGRSDMTAWQSYASPVGELLLAADEEGLTGLWLAGEKYFPGVPEDAPQETPRCWRRPSDGWISILRAGSRTSCRRFIWQAPPSGRRCGRCCDRSPTARPPLIGRWRRPWPGRRGLRQMSAQAVGGAVGHNPISIIVPCHRVVGSDGNLTGYAGGLERKVQLLRLEGVDMSRLYVPKKGTAL